jgi:hypothetical protein
MSTSVKNISTPLPYLHQSPSHHAKLLLDLCPIPTHCLLLNLFVLNFSEADPSKKKEGNL